MARGGITEGVPENAASRVNRGLADGIVEQALAQLVRAESRVGER